MEKIKPYLNGIIMFILVIGIGFGVYYLVKLSKQSEQSSPEENISYSQDVPSQPEFNQEYKNEDHHLSLKYHQAWKTKDLGGEKNVTTPLVRENIIFLYDPIDPDKEDEVGASLKLLRFVLEPEKKIESADDWYDYVKEKVDDFIADKELTEEIGYKLISLEKHNDINGYWVIQEDYKRKDNLRGRDFYIYAEDLYQFVCKSNQDNFDFYSSYFEEIVNSFTINK